MTNKQLARLFNELAGLMEIHEANAFKVRTYQNAYAAIRRQPQELYGLSREDLIKIPGIGKSVAAKISEHAETGVMKDLQDLRDRTPEGVRQMFKIRGIGAKKIKVIWKDMGIENLGDLLYACEENRLIEWKGFGPKIQEKVREGILFLRANQGKLLLSHALEVADRFQRFARERGIEVEAIGDVLTLEPVVEKLEFATLAHAEDVLEADLLAEVEVDEEGVSGLFEEEYRLSIDVDVEDLAEWAIATSAASHLKEVITRTPEEDFYPPAFLWKHSGAMGIAVDRLVKNEDIKGVIHNHTTYSDGAHNVGEMARACIDKGYEYLVVSDHSKSAFYANGLREDDLVRQWAEIDALNDTLKDFVIYKSIESDILADGSLDYADDILREFDLVIASVHAHLNMDVDKATARLIKAIEHPSTRILGHMTGRLLLGRPGYPVDHAKVLDACAANDVAIELNANPHRLDMDYRYLGDAMDRGVLVSINPDAHHVDGIDDIRYGVMMARKGGLLREFCLNVKDRSAFEDWLG
jgi:DNA polymerase (family 10)